MRFLRKNSIFMSMFKKLSIAFALLTLISSRIEMPEGMSHGTAIRVDRKVVERLIKVYQ